MKIFKQIFKITIIPALVLTTGCSATIDAWKIKKANDFCVKHGGINYMLLTMGQRVVCMDGSLHEIHLSIKETK